MYLTSFDDEARVVAIVERSDLLPLFLTFPGQVIQKERVCEAFELLMGCLAEDNDMSLQPLNFALTRLLCRARMHDVDDQYLTDFYGTARAWDVLKEYGMDTERHAITVDTDVVKPTSFNHRFLRETFFFGKKVAEGYGHNAPAAARANGEEVQSSPLIETYCRELREVYLTIVSKLVLSEINLSSVFPVENYLRNHYKCTDDEFEDYFECYELEPVKRKTSVDIPIFIRPHLCVFVVDEEVVSVGISVTPERSQMLAMRRLVVSLRESLPMDKILSRDPAANLSEVYNILADYYPHIPYDLETIKPYVI